MAGTEESPFLNESLEDAQGPGQKLEREEIRALLKEYRQSRDPQVREKLILLHMDFVINLSRKFAGRGEPLKDLIQVGNLGLIQAIDRFDTRRGVEFVTFAIPTILGEIKRYFRDKGWMIKVPRRLQELNQSVSKKVELLTQKLGRSPTIVEIACSLKTTEEDVIEALELGQAYNPVSLNASIPVDEEVHATLMELAGETDEDIESIGEKETLKNAMKCLSEDEKQIIHFRFYKGLTQTEVSRILKVSQMQVSRLQNRALRKMRNFMKMESFRNRRE